MTNSDQINLVVSNRALPLVTIAIPTFNRSGFLRSAIDSALAQAYEAIEVVVSDNGSIDETAKVVESYHDDRLRYVRQESNIGLVANWNACLNLAKGEYCLILSDDDRLAPNAIRELVSGFDECQVGTTIVPSKDIAFVYGNCEIDSRLTNKISLSLSAPPQESSAAYRIGVLRGVRVSYPSATLFRTKDALEVGGYSSRFEVAIDIGLAFEISALYPKVVYTEAITTYYLFHPQNFTSSIGTEALLGTIDMLGQQAIHAISPQNYNLFRETKKACARAHASALASSLVRHYSKGEIEFRHVAVQFWQYRNLFWSVGCAGVLIKGMARLILAIPRDVLHQRNTSPNLLVVDRVKVVIRREYKLLKKIAQASMAGFRLSALQGRLWGPKVLMNSLPKSGTNLLEQVLIQLPYMRRRMRYTLGYWDGSEATTLRQLSRIRRGEFLAAHLTATEYILQTLLRENFKTLMMIRDPRDIAVSHFNYVTYIDYTHPSHQYFKSLPDDDARLMAVIEGVDGIVQPIWRVLEQYRPWLTADGVLVVRFEHLIGARGGGDDQLQMRTVSDIARHLNIPIDETQLSMICSEIYSETSPTFRKSQIGDWGKVFKPEHITAFMRSAGEYMKYYGYPVTGQNQHHSP